MILVLWKFLNVFDRSGGDVRFYYNYSRARMKKKLSKNLLICHRTITVGSKTFKHAVEKIKGITQRDV